MGWTPRTIMSNEDRNHVFLLSLSLSHLFSSSSICQNRIGYDIGMYLCMRHEERNGSERAA